MAFGTSIFLIAVGAILKYAITDSLDDVDLSTVGLILMIAGALGIVLSLIVAPPWVDRRGADVDAEGRPFYRRW
jgi:hypothetical protein